MTLSLKIVGIFFIIILSITLTNKVQGFNSIQLLSKDPSKSLDLGLISLIIRLERSKKIEKNKPWKQLPIEERAKKKRRYQDWFKKLPLKERKKLNTMYQNPKVTEKKLRTYIEYLFRKYGRPSM